MYIHTVVMKEKDNFLILCVDVDILFNEMFIFTSLILTFPESDD